MFFSGGKIRLMSPVSQMCSCRRRDAKSFQQGFQNNQPELIFLYFLNSLKVWFTLATEAETEESLRSSVNHENGDGSTSGSGDGSGDGRNGSVPFSSVASSASVVLPSQTSKCEPILTEAQAETEGWANENALFQSLSRNSCKHGEIYYLVIQNTMLPNCMIHKFSKRLKEWDCSLKKRILRKIYIPKI